MDGRTLDSIEKRQRTRNFVAYVLILLAILVGFAILAEFGIPVKWGPI